MTFRTPKLILMAAWLSFLAGCDEPSTGPVEISATVTSTSDCSPQFGICRISLEVVGAPGEGSSATGIDGDQVNDSAPSTRPRACSGTMTAELRSRDSSARKCSGSRVREASSGLVE